MYPTQRYFSHTGLTWEPFSLFAFAAQRPGGRLILPWVTVIHSLTCSALYSSIHPQSGLGACSCLEVTVRLQSQKFGLSNASLPARERLTTRLRRQSGTQRACPGSGGWPHLPPPAHHSRGACPGCRQPGPHPAVFPCSPALAFLALPAGKMRNYLCLWCPSPSVSCTAPASTKKQETQRGPSCNVGCAGPWQILLLPPSPDGDGSSSSLFFHFQASPCLLPTPPTHSGGTAHKHVQNYLITPEPAALPLAAGADGCADHANFAPSLLPICAHHLPGLQALDAPHPAVVRAWHLGWWQTQPCVWRAEGFSPCLPAAGCLGFHCWVL